MGALVDPAINYEVQDPILELKQFWFLSEDHYKFIYQTAWKIVFACLPLRLSESTLYVDRTKRLLQQTVCGREFISSPFHVVVDWL